tara:strand:- start:49483 stop:51252 length:1770 start_codon:yes stop_codon:yes gene_type:complete
MIKKIFLSVVFALPIFLVQAKQVSNPVSVIFDTDMGFDYDDVGALAVLHALEKKGGAKILATIASTKYEGVAAVLNVLNTYYGKPDIPIGVPKGDALILKDSQGWSDTLLTKYLHHIWFNKEVPGAVELYRRILKDRPDNSVTLLTVGFLTNIAALLASPADNISPLSGKELVERKVYGMVSKAGEFPSGKEFNIEEDVTAANYVFKNWKRPLLFSGFEIGSEIKTGLPLVQNTDVRNSPVKDVYRISMPQAEMDAEGRMSWDQTAVMVAIRGYGSHYRPRSGKIQIGKDGSNTWNPKGNHQYLIATGPQGEMQRTIDDLMMELPTTSERPLVVFVLGDHEYSGEETMPILAAELEKNYGIRTKVLKASPDQNSEENIPGLEALEDADLAVFFLRWRRLPSEQIAHIENYLKSGRPVLGLRTSTHAFNYPEGHELEKWNAFGEMAFNAPPGWEKKGHTHYGHESTTIVSVMPEAKEHPILTGVQKKFPAQSWLYTVLPEYPLKGSESLLMGKAVNPDDPQAIDHPVAWTGTNSFGGKFFMTTLGHPEDFREVSMQQLIINAVHWTLGKQIPAPMEQRLDINVPYRGIEE